jgi:molybdopterin-containing oxidoreductase family membrane subunit
MRKTEKNTDFKEDQTVDLVAADVLKQVGFSRNFNIWMGFLTAALLVCLYAYSLQLRKGLSVTGLGDIVSWGMYIATFVFFVATSLVGMLISSVLGLIGYKWIKPISRIAEIIAVAFAALAGVVIVSDMGRPERLSYVFRFGRVQSPIVWDITVVTTYLTISLLLYFIPLIPDLAISKGRIGHTPKFLQKTYEVLSLKWTHSSAQFRLLFKSIRILLILIIPNAFAIHTVTSWLFAVNPRAGWNSTIFGPYFISGAFVVGVAAVIILMYIVRVTMDMSKYLTDDHFDKIGKVMVIVSLLYLYFNINEFLVPGYKMEKVDALHLNDLFAGKFAPTFWFAQIGGILLPIIALLFRKMRKPLPMLIIGVIVFIASWFKRLIIVVPPLADPYLPKQNYPVQWLTYKPTLIETLITTASFILALMIISVLVKLFPVISIWEVAEEKRKEDEKKL